MAENSPSTNVADDHRRIWHEDDQRQAWSSRGARWVRNIARFDAALAPFTEAIMQAADITDGDRVLDVGCGPGTLLDEATTRGATCVGVDISETMLDAARERVPSATLIHADAQEINCAEETGGPFDCVVSRFGVMFFPDPVTAFSTIRHSTSPGGRLVCATWRADETNIFTQGLETYEAILGEKAPRPRPGRPGPLGLGEKDHILDVLTRSGWQDIAITPLDGVCDFTMGSSDGVDNRLSILLDGALGSFLTEGIGEKFGAQRLEEAHDEARAAIRESMPDGVRFTSKIWIITASR